MLAEDDDLTRLLSRVSAEYDEMPGLSLTAPQARLLFGLDPEACGEVLDRLMRQHVLRRAPTGQYVRNDREPTPEV
jgi:hypothetical protein